MTHSSQPPAAQTEKPQEASLLWLDLEMTGLSPEKDRILEVAAIATDWQFRELATYEASVKQSPTLIQSRMTGEFWDKNPEARQALTTGSQAGKSPSVVQAELLSFIKKHFKQTFYLAGNSIHQDRKFIEKYWPKLNEAFHYRMLDVSAWKIYFENARSHHIQKPEAHRALDDIRGSIEELKCYTKQIS